MLHYKEQCCTLSQDCPQVQWTSLLFPKNIEVVRAPENAVSALKER